MLVEKSLTIITLNYFLLIHKFIISGRFKDASFTGAVAS
jgi:hypothetical protein